MSTSSNDSKLHIIRSSHITDPNKISSLLVDLIDLSEGDLYFDESTERFWRNPASIPPLFNYIVSLQNTLLRVGASIVPMGDPNLLHVNVPGHLIAACQSVEDVYMVNHIVVPVLERNTSSKAVINVGYGHAARFDEELRKLGYEPKIHTLCERAPEIDYIEAVRDFAECRRETYLVEEFITDFYHMLLDKMGLSDMQPPVASELLACGNPEFVAKFREVAQDVFADETLYGKHTKVPDAPLDKQLRETCKEAEKRCEELRKYANHPVIPAKSLRF